MNSLQQRKYILAGFMLLYLTAFMNPATSFAQNSNETLDSFQQSLDIDLDSKKDNWEYSIEGRPDPFTPFISEKAPTSPETERKGREKKKILTGMQLFEPGQLTLVSIVLGKHRNFAMVQDFTGQGYILRPGMEIGEYGLVTSITQNQVKITETRTTGQEKLDQKLQKPLTNEIFMLLKKEGEE